LNNMNILFTFLD